MRISIIRISKRQFIQILQGRVPHIRCPNRLLVIQRRLIEQRRADAHTSSQLIGPHALTDLAQDRIRHAAEHANAKVVKDPPRAGVRDGVRRIADLRAGPVRHARVVGVRLGVFAAGVEGFKVLHLGRGMVVGMEDASERRSRTLAAGLGEPLRAVAEPEDVPAGEIAICAVGGLEDLGWWSVHVPLGVWGAEWNGAVEVFGHVGPIVCGIEILIWIATQRLDELT